MSELKYRKTNRLKNYDYSQNGMYFVTICTEHRKRIFGKILESKIFLNSYGKIAKNHIELINEKYDGVYVDKYAIMPNHIHMLLLISRERIVCVPKGDRSKEFLPKIIQSLKATITKDIKSYKKWNAYDAFPTIWQKGYFEHIVRDYKDYENSWLYIENNPLQWEFDEYFEKE